MYKNTKAIIFRRNKMRVIYSLVIEKEIWGNDFLKDTVNKM